MLKNILLIVVAGLLLSGTDALADKAGAIKAKAIARAKRKMIEKDAFNKFGATASGLNKTNAYLLGYMSLMVYPQNLAPVSGVSEAVLQANAGNKFEQTFIAQTQHLFAGDPVMKFFSKTTPMGFNPEAMCIASAKEIIVVFRGTDKLVINDKGPIGAIVGELGEWLITDGNVLPLERPKDGIGGLLHKGMKKSLDAVDADIAKFVMDNGGATKPVWLTGHSLGGGMAQIMGAYLKKRGANVKGMYLYNSCHPGNVDFANALNTLLGKTNIQRFEYLDDPIAMLPPQTTVTQLISGLPGIPRSPLGGFGRAGVRNFYSKLDGANFFQNQAERAEGTNNRQNLGLSGVFSPLAICYHNPHWICNASYYELPEDQRRGLPSPPDLDDCQGCGPFAFETGRTGITIENQVINTVQEIAFNAAKVLKNVADNLLPGASLEDGKYTIKSLKGERFLDVPGSCDGTAEGDKCPIQLWGARRAGADGFTLERDGALPLYKIKFKGKVLEVKKSDYQKPGAQVQTTKTDNPVPVDHDNQRWLVWKITGNKYLILNWNVGAMNNLMALDAKNSCATADGCDVKTGKLTDNDATQVWVIQRVN